MKKIMLIASALAAVNAFAITATKEYVDNATNATRTAVRGEITSATNATFAAAKSYTDQAVAGCVPGNYETVSNRAMNAVQTETDPTVPSWAKAATKPTYDAWEVGALSTDGGTLDGDVDASGHGISASTFYASDAIETPGQLSAGGLVVGSDGATVEGDISISGEAIIGGDVTISGGATVSGTLSGGGVTLQNDDVLYGNNKSLNNLTTQFDGKADLISIAPFWSGSVTYADGFIVRMNGSSRWYVSLADNNAGKNPTSSPAWWAYYTSYEAAANAALSRRAKTSEVGTIATNVAEEVNATTRAIVATWENFLDGSNVVFSITNYISGTYNLDAAKLRIMEMTNGVYREVYNSRDEILLHIDDFKNTDFRVATNQVIQGVSAAIADKADKAWGKYTSAGGEAPSNTVYMTAPQTVFAGGMEYERVAVGEGSVCILTTKGAPTYTQGDEGTFKFQDDGGTNYFGFAKTDSYVIGADASGISVQNHIVTINYDVTMSGVPCIWYKQAIESDVEWEQLNLPDGTPIAGASHVVSWEATPPAGRETCYINCPEANGFFKATIEVAGSAKFMTNMPADFSGGILCTDGQHKVKINWNNGAPTLVPAN